MVTARLVAPGAISPVSTLPSFRTMRWVTRSLFWKTTDWPPNIAGLGANACVPFCPRIVIVGTAGAGEGVGAVEPPPPQPEAAMTLTNANAVNTTRQFITSSFRTSDVFRACARQIPAEIGENQRVCAKFSYRRRKRLRGAGQCV